MTMTTDEMRRLAAEAFPRCAAPRSTAGRPTEPYAKLADALGVNRATAYRWHAGKAAIPQWVADELRLLHAVRCGPSPRLAAMLNDGTLRALASEWADASDYVPVRDGPLVWLLLDGQPDSVGVWDDHLGIIKIRTIIDEGEVRVLSSAVRSARGARLDAHIRPATDRPTA